MQIEVLKSSKDEIQFKIFDVDHTIGNLLKEELSDDSGVIMAGYRKEHPLLKYSVFVLRTKGKNPKTALNQAIGRLSDKLDEFSKKIKL